MLGSLFLENHTYLFTCVDASYAVHPNMRIHTGGLMSMGYVMLHFRYSKKNLYANISTEAELIVTSEYVPFNVGWLCFWMHKDMRIITILFFKTIRLP